MIPLFKIRCSDIGKIMGGAFTSPTPKQLARLAELQQKEKRTEKQDKELSELITKRDSKPELQEGAKTYCEQWLKEQLYERHKGFSSKYTEKGVECEADGLNLVARRMGYTSLTKNTERKQNEYMTGECDAVQGDTIEEIKNSWDCFTFPLFDAECPSKEYPLQVQGYMELWNKPKAAVNYVLIDTPDFMIEKEARVQAYKLGMQEVEAEMYDEVYNKSVYAGIPDELRHKRYEFTRNDQIIRAIEQQVILCRKYIAKLYVSLYPTITDTDFENGNG